MYAQIPPAIRPEVEALFKETAKYDANESYRQILFFSNFMKLLIYLEQYTLERTPSPSGFAAGAVDYINNHLSEELSVDDIASAVHMSKFYFCRRFKEIMGLTAMDYILKTRLASAKSLLKEDELSIGEISEKCGFSSISYFCRVFKEDTGMTALAYRKKYRQPSH